MEKRKILLFDVETTYIKCYAWRTGEQYVSHDMIVEGSKTDIIVLCYKWLGERTTHALIWDRKKQDSSKLMKRFASLVEGADLVLGHNAKKFDIKQVNTQRLLSGLPPIAWPAVEDTLATLRKHFSFPSNKLDYVSKILFGEGKNPMVFQDWKNIIEKDDSKSLEKMVRYCKKDVILLERLVKLLLPYMNLRLSHRDNTCPNCGSERYQSMGFRRTVRYAYRRYRCKNCGKSFIGEKITEETNEKALKP